MFELLEYIACGRKIPLWHQNVIMMKTGVLRVLVTKDALSMLKVKRLKFNNGKTVLNTENQQGANLLSDW